MMDRQQVILSVSEARQSYLNFQFHIDQLGSLFEVLDKELIDWSADAFQNISKKQTSAIEQLKEVIHQSSKTISTQETQIGCFSTILSHIFKHSHQMKDQAIAAVRLNIIRSTALIESVVDKMNSDIQCRSHQPQFYLYLASNLAIDPRRIFVSTRVSVHCTPIIGYPLQKSVIATYGPSLPSNVILSPHGMIHDMINKRLWVAAWGTHNIHIFNIDDGSHFKTIGSQGSGDGQFDRPHGMALSYCQKTVLITDSNNARVVFYDLDGHYIKSIGKKGCNPGEFDLPQFLCFDALNNFYVSDYNNRRIQKFDEDGKFLKTIGDRYSPHPVGCADGICINDYQEILCLPSRSNMVHVYSVDGKLLRRHRVVLSTSWNHIARGPDGGFFISNTSDLSIRFYSRDGIFVFALQALPHRLAMYDGYSRFLVSSTRNIVEVYEGTETS